MGATVDANILKLLSDPQTSPEFLMEVTDKTRADVKVRILLLIQGEEIFMLKSFVLSWSVSLNLKNFKDSFYATS